MASESTLRFGAQTDEVTSLLRIVNLVRTGEAVTRPEIGRLTGLGRGVVTQRVSQAIAMGFLEDAELAPSSGGRSPRTLRFRSAAGRIVICALGALHIHVGVADISGDIVDQTHLDWEIARGPAETLEVVRVMIAEVLARLPEAPIWGIAVGLPGPVDFATGRPVAPPIMPGWNGFDVRRWFEQRFGAPVWVDNDVNLLALAERARRPREAVDLIYCKIGSGMGVGLLSRGRIHRGAVGAAGDVGHVRFGDFDVLCRCGKRGCLEAVAGGWALVRDAEAAIADGATGQLALRLQSGGTLAPEDISRAAENGDALAIALIQRSARIVGGALAGIVNMFNPSVIIVGGAVAAAGELFLAEVRQRIYEMSLPLATRDLSVVNSIYDDREPLRGGAELVREQLFDVSFPRWFADARPMIETTQELKF